MIHPTESQRHDTEFEPQYHELGGTRRHAGTQTTTRERSIGELLKELRDESTLLIRQEVLLAKQEISEKTARIGRNAGYLGAGAGIAYAGAILILFAITAGVYAALVAMGMSHMASGAVAPAIVGIIAGLIAYSMIRKAQRTIADEMSVPVHTEETLQENTRWMKEKVSR